MKLLDLILEDRYTDFTKSMSRHNFTEPYTIGDYMIEKLPQSWINAVSKYNNGKDAGEKMALFFKGIDKLHKNGGEVYRGKYQWFKTKEDAINDIADNFEKYNLRGDPKNMKKPELIKKQISPKGINIVKTIQQYLKNPGKEFIILV